ncbi:sperm motility kinase X-like [Cricetulus griseus]|uniref:non-specific serine/threonine protein kinase n=1 Tax=Cricetulus griseus TaxID=10029 RepID=A0A9J7H2P9_CRIGR|nr:sperm motility kinase X-like [Cricetulus griseus]
MSLSIFLWDIGICSYQHSPVPDMNLFFKLPHCEFGSSHINEDLIMEQGREACYSCEESFLSDYKMMMTVGHGRFSEVKLAFHLPTVTCVAVKVLRMTKKNTRRVANEVSIMKSLQHPNIIKLFQVVQSRDTTYLVMEHASEGDLLRHILELGSLQESEARRLFTQILLAVQYCHENHIAHRDIKANNILLDCRGNAKLCDFGLATKVTPGQKLRNFCGTLLYCAPELFVEKAYDGCAADIWSLGVLLFLMVVGRFPFRDRSPKGVRRQILAANFKIPQHVSIDIFNVIVEMLMINPDRRPTIDQIMTRPMIRDSKTRSPPMSTQKLPCMVSPGIVSTMTVLGYTSEEIIDSLRDKTYNQVMATYLILQHQSPGGDCGHQQEKTMQPGHVLNLADLQAFPVPLRRATEPATPNFTLPTKPQEKEEKKNTRKGGIRHSMPVTLFRKSEKTYHSHLVYQKRRRALLLTCSSEEMSENFSDSKIRSSGSLMSSVQTSLLMYTASSSLDHNETTHDTDNISSCSYQEELWSSMETAQSVTPTGSFSGDIFQVDTITREAISEEVNITEEKAMNEKDTITQERTITQEESITEEVTITQGEDITEQATIIQEEDMAHEVTMTLEETRTKEVTMADGMTQTESITEEETVIKHEDIILEATITREETMAQLATLTQEDGITQEEAITHGQPEDAGPASSANRRRSSWKRVKKIMVNCLRRLCCCLPPATRRQDSCRTLTPKKRDPAVTHRSSSEEVQPQLHGL